MTTVPSGTPPKNDSANAPQQVQTGGVPGPVPSKPSATTGPGGPNISVPRVGKNGK